MSKENPARSLIEKSSLFKPLFRSKGNKRRGLAWMGIAGLIGVGLLVYLALSGIVNKPGIRFNPADVVYGVKVHASHEMMMDSGSNISNNLPADTGARPEIQVSEQLYDFGEVGANQVLKHTFVIANLGQVSLVIVHA
jgi:hypothetical protein